MAQAKWLKIGAAAFLSIGMLTACGDEEDLDVDPDPGIQEDMDTEDDTDMEDDMDMEDEE